MTTAIPQLAIRRPAIPVHLSERARKYASSARSEVTKRAYRNDWQHFEGWCHSSGYDPLPADRATIAAFLVDNADEYAVSTLERRLAAISQAHKAAGYRSPTSTRDEPLHSIWSGIVREKGREQDTKAPLLIEHIRKILDLLPLESDNETKRVRALRDKALILIGFAGGFRRSELAALKVADLSFEPEGVKIRLRRSKTDQEGEGRTVGIMYGRPETCPVRALRAWIEAVALSHGPLFRSILHSGEMLDSMSAGNVAVRIKTLMDRAGFDATKYSGHSLRAGLATQAARNGAAERDIMRQTGHKSERMVRRYIREGGVFVSNVTANLGL